jgi:glycosyltransferase involved in cell wall biosynthesis
MSNPLISIALATYNGQNHLRAQLDSIINQTYKNIEIVASDDCSSDNTEEILKEYAKDHNLTYKINSKNLGFRQNFQEAILMCKGEYIALSDQDDIWVENKLELLLQKLQKTNMVLVYSDVTKIDNNLKSLNEHIIKPKFNFYEGDDSLCFMHINICSGNAMMFKSSLIEHIIPISKIHPYHDWYIATIATKYGGVCYLEDDLVFYRRHSAQVTNEAEKNYKSIKDRFQKKNKKTIKWAEEHLNIFKSYSYIYNDLKDADKEILKEAINHHRNYNNKIFNLRLFKLLFLNKDRLFAFVPSNKRVKKAFIYSLGLRGHALTLFSFGL